MSSIPLHEVDARLAIDNPWWGLSPLREDVPKRKRLYFPLFHELASDRSVRRACILMGPRRVGKTVMIKQLIHKLIEDGIAPANMLYASVDTPLYTGMRLDEFVSLAAERHGFDLNGQSYVFFDEIQYLKDWERHLKNLIDTFPAIQFVASGSAAAALKLKSRESGAGRFTDFILPPLTFAEYIKFIGREKLIAPSTETGSYETEDIDEVNRHFIDYINIGGYPETVFSKAVQRDPGRFIRSDIIDKVLLRDLPSLYGISDIQDLNRLFTSLAYLSGQEVSYDALASESGVSKNTLKRYLEYLEAAFLISRLRRVDDNNKSFQRERSFKVYLTNTSMRAALFSPVEGADPLLGHLVETAALSQWMHSRAWRDLHYARWKKGEIDLVSLNGAQRPRWCVEIKWSDKAALDTRQVAPLIEYCLKHNIAKPLITTKSLTKRIIIQKDLCLECEPVALYSYAVGFNSIRDQGWRNNTLEKQPLA